VYLRVEMPHYPVFLLCGILPWAWFSPALNEATNSIISNGGLIKKVYLPSEIFPLVCVGSHAVHYLLSVPILFVFLAVFGIPLSWPLLFFPLIAAIQFMFTYSLALFVSSMAVQFRDLLHIMPNILMVWFFLTPILYPASSVPPAYRPLLELNPVAHLIMSYQDVLFYGRTPSPGRLTVLAALACGLLVLGLAFFEARKDVFAEEV
jgi:ABC-type polysaccharide/polyol phosphate export permease